MQDREAKSKKVKSRWRVKSRLSKGDVCAKVVWMQLRGWNKITFTFYF